MKLFRDEVRMRLILNFMFRYIMVLIIPFVLISAIYINSIKIIEQDTIKSNITMLEKARDILDSRMSEVDSIAEQISWNTKVISFNNVIQPYKGANTYKVIDTRSQLYDYSLTNSLIHDYFVIYLKSGILMGANQTYRIEQFYKYFFHYTGIGYDSWYREVSLEYHKRTLIPERQTYFKGKQYNLVTYIRNLSGTTNGRYCKIMFLLKGDEIKKLLDGFDLDEDGWAYIADNRGQIFSSYSLHSDMAIHTIKLEGEKNGYSIQDYRGQKTIFTYVVSENSGWRFVVAQPYENVMKKVSNIKNMGYGIFALALLLGIVIAYFWSSRYSRSIIKTFNLFPQREDKYEIKRDPYEYIQNSIYEVIENNELLSHTVDQQISFLRNSFYQQLINGEFSDEKDLDAGARHIGLELNGAAYAACVVQVLGYGQGLTKADDEILKELDIRRMQVREALLTHIFLRTYTHEIARERILLIIVLESDNFGLYQKQISDYVEAVKKDVMRNHGIEVRFALDQIYTKPMDLTSSIQQEIHMLNYAQMGEKGQHYLWCNEIQIDENTFYFPKDLEHRLLNFTKDGNCDRVTEILKQLEISNLIRRKLSSGMLRAFIYQLYGALIRCAHELSVENQEISRFADKINIPGDLYSLYDEAFKLLNSSFIYLCEIVNERKENQSTKLMIEVRDYIKANYTDRNLSLSVLAEKFNYSPAYLSLFFKEELGGNFSAYLEEIRMVEATKLLTESDISIGEIANVIGYNSSNSFCRAFKRKFQVSPGQYRQLNMKS